MRLSDSYLSEIAYLGFPAPGEAGRLDVLGTGFLMVHDEHTYLVTAAHVAVELADGPFGVRLNRQDTQQGDIDYIDQATWYFHADDKVDVAVLPYQPPNWSKVTFSKSKWIATEFKVRTKDLGPGDIAYVIGVFQKMRGKDRNLPVVHTGHIGSMAYGEKLLTDDWRPGAKQGAMVEIEGYLIQVPTLPESSGSPVYVRRSLEGVGGRDQRDDSSVRTWVYGSAWLLGLWHGMWETEERGVVVGTNMGVCTPASRILEVLERRELKEKRDGNGSTPAKKPSGKKKIRSK